MGVGQPSVDASTAVTWSVLARATTLAIGLGAAGCGRISYDALLAGPLDAAVDAGAPEDAALPDATANADGAADGGDASSDGGGVPTNARLTNDAYRSAAPSIAVGAGRSMVTWSDDRAGALEVVARVFEPGFAPVAGELRLTTTAESSEAAMPVWNGTSWGIFWLEVGTTSATVWAAEVSADGGTVLVTPRALTGATSAGGNVSVAFGDGVYFVAWPDQRFGGASVMLARVPVGLATAPTEQRLTTGAGRAYFPSVAWTGSELGVFFNDDRAGNLEIYFARAMPDLTPIDETRLTNTEGISAAPVCAWTGTEYAVVWNEQGAVDDDVWFGAVSTTGGAIATFEVATPASTLFPAVAFGGGALMLVWGDDRETARQVYGETTDASTRAESAHVRVSDGPAESAAGFPSVAADGSAFAVVYADTRNGNSEIYGVRLTPR